MQGKYLECKRTNRTGIRLTLRLQMVCHSCRCLPCLNHSLHSSQFSHYFIDLITPGSSRSSSFASSCKTPFGKFGDPLIWVSSFQMSVPNQSLSSIFYYIFLELILCLISSFIILSVRLTLQFLRSKSIFVALIFF